MSGAGENEPPPGGEPAEGSAPSGEGPRASGLGPPESEVLVPGELPIANVDEALRSAVGASGPVHGRPEARSPRPPSTDVHHDDDGLDAASDARRRKTVIVSALAIVVGLTIAAMVFLGRANAQRYLLVCASDHVKAEQGRAFPPWGSRAMGGPEWKAIPLPPNATCKEGETHELQELSGWYLAILIDRASATLAAKDLIDRAPGKDGKTSDLDVAAAQLDQALLLSRDPDWDKERKQVEHLQGDVEYWRAALRLRDAQAALADAAKQFDAAAARKPSHVKDSADWASLVRHLSNELHAGPDAMQAPVPPPPVAGEPHQPAPFGTALPVEPPPAGSAAVASEPEAPSPTPPPNAPTGGILL